MCLSPLLIRNPKKDALIGFDSPYLSVPCGHCTECRMHKADDWYIRNYYEFLDCTEKGGYAQLFTLTYNDENLPVCTSSKLPAFSREHIKGYLKRVRHRIGYGTLRFFISCEYGDEFHRPHYHFVFYVDGSVPRDQLMSALRSSWTFGYTYTSDIEDGLVQDVRGIRYAAKYATKDLLQDEWYKSQCSRLKEDIKRKYSVYSNLKRYSLLCDGVYNREYKEFQKHRPFIQCSKGFGARGIQYLRDNERFLLDGYLRIPSPFKADGDKMKVPLYYERKLMYDVVKQYRTDTDYVPVYQLNEYGYKIKSQRLSLELNAFKHQLKKLERVYDMPAFRSSDEAKDVDFNIPNFFTQCHLTDRWLKQYLYARNYVGCDNERDTLRLRSFDVDKYQLDYYQYKLFGLSSPYSTDGILWCDLSSWHHECIEDFISSPEFKQFHLVVSLTSSYLSKVESKRQLYEESIKVQQKILKRRLRRKYNKNN